MFNYSNNGQTNLESYKVNNHLYEINIPFYGLRTKVFGTDINYYFNYKKYSNVAAYANNHRFHQIKNSDSFIVGLSLIKYDFLFDFSELNSESQLYKIHDIKLISNNYDTYNISFGYAYNLVISRKWMINLSVLPSIGIKENNINQDLGLAFRNKSKLAIIYNLPNYFLGINCHYNINWFNAKNNTISNSLGKFNLILGVRF